jgi:hypothetical protein
MSDTFETFSYQAVPTPLHRRGTRRARRATVAGVLVLALVVSFARWVTDSERASLQASARQATLPVLVGSLPGATETAVARLDAPMTSDDRQAQRVARDVLHAARRLAAAGSFYAAGPDALSRLMPDYTFVVGPSPVPQVVSVAATKHAWGVAVAAITGRCFMIRATRNAPTRFGISVTGCSGGAALRITASAW